MIRSFKETEIGSIPSDWKVVNLKQLGSFKKGKNIPKSAIAQEGVPCVLYGEIYTRYNEQATKLISKIPKESSKNSTEIQYGDILFAGSGETAEDIGKCFAYCGTEKGFAGGDVIIFTPDNGDSLYLGYLLNSSPIVKQKSLMGQGSSVFHIYPSGLEKIKIPLPPTKIEQTAIATALSDAGALIISLERLIAKKKAIKQGAMQELLKPKGTWKIKSLGEIANFYSGGTPSTSNPSYYGGVIPWITSSDLNKKKIYEVVGRITEEGMRNSAAKMVKKGMVLIAMYGATAGVTAITCISAAINQAVLAIDLFEDNPNFLYYTLVNLKDWIVNTYTQGGQANLSGSIIKAIEISLPGYNEQTAIAQILSDMDAEIILLEQKLEKQKLIKQGMMQVLLTGKIRLI